MRKRTFGVPTLERLFCKLGVLCCLEAVNEGDGFKVAMFLGGVSGVSSTACNTICGWRSSLLSFSLGPFFFVGESASSLDTLVRLFNGDDDKYTAARLFICVGDLPLGEYKCVGDDDNIPPCGDDSKFL